MTVKDVNVLREFFMCGFVVPPNGVRVLIGSLDKVVDG